MSDERFESKMDPDELARFLAECEIEEDQDDLPRFMQPPEHVPPPPPRRIITGPVPGKTVLTQADRALVAQAKSTANRSNKVLRVREIKRELVMSNRSYVLTAQVSKIEKQMIIEELVAQYTAAAEKAKTKLTRLIEERLKMYIPQNIKVAFATNPDTFAVYEGFDYIASPYFDKAKLRIVPNIPKFFVGPTEMDVIKAKCQKYRYTYDRLVEEYYFQTKKRIVKEARHAVKINRAKNVLDLLELGLEYYEAYDKINK